MIVAAELENDDSLDMHQEDHSRPRDRYAGARALWLKVIIRAIFDWVTYRDSPRLMQKKLADSAETWLFEKSELFNGFENVCLDLGIDPDHVRNRAKRMSKDDVAKIEHLERSADSDEKVYRIRSGALLEPCNEEVA